MEISFDKLCDLVANIDSVFAESYSVYFRIENGEDCREYECGIGYTEDERIMNDYEFSVCSDTYQYLAEIKRVDDGFKYCFIDLQVEDGMSYEGICKMLREKCGITDESKIFLDEGMSFDGVQQEITDDLVASELKIPCEDDFEL